MPRILLAAVVVLALNSPALAYNKAAHMVSGAIAFHALKADSPQTLEKIVALLNQHPDRDKFKLDAVSAEDRDLYLLMLALAIGGNSRRATALLAETLILNVLRRNRTMPQSDANCSRVLHAVVWRVC